MNHVDLMRPITKWAVSVPSARRLGEYVSTAFRVATTNVPGPVFLEMPLDFLFDTVNDDDVVVSEQYRTEAGVGPDPRFVEKAFELLRGAERPVCLVGSQLFWSRRREAYPEFVRTFGMPVYVNGQARGSLDPGRSALVPPDPQGRAQEGRRRAHLRHAARLPHRLRPQLAHQPGREAHPRRPRRQGAGQEPRLRRRHHRRHRAGDGGAHRRARAAPSGRPRCRALARRSCARSRARSGRSCARSSPPTRRRSTRCACAPRSTSWSPPTPS